MGRKLLALLWGLKVYALRVNALLNRCLRFFLVDFLGDGGQGVRVLVDWLQAVLLLAEGSEQSPRGGSPEGLGW